MIDLQSKIAVTREICSSEMEKPPLRDTARLFDDAGLARENSIPLLRSVVSAPDRKSQLLSIVERIGAFPELLLDRAAVIQRVLLLRASLLSLERLDVLPVDASVRSMICDEFQFFARPSPRDLNLFQPENYSLLAFVKTALLERFPCGQFHFEVSGFPRSWLFKVPRRELPRISYFLAAKVKGFEPLFFPHLATRPHPTILLEKVCDKSWYRIARTVELQPAIKGLVASSWLYSPDTFKVSPHLSFINKPFIESGALVTTMGKASERDGFLTGGSIRRKLYESGEFKPTVGLVLWSREQMIRWANSHPELGDQ